MTIFPARNTRDRAVTDPECTCNGMQCFPFLSPHCNLLPLGISNPPRTAHTPPLFDRSGTPFSRADADQITLHIR